MRTDDSLLSDPSSFDGFSAPDSFADPEPDEITRLPTPTKTNVLNAGGAAGSRALATQLVAFYFRAPVKAFFKARVDYMAVARAINPRVVDGAGWSWKVTTPGLLIHAVRNYGWKFIPDQVLPPLLANATLGAILYTSYLQTLAHIDTAEKGSPPAVASTFLAGCLAGSIQSVLGAPLDALNTRINVHEMLTGRHNTLWSYAMVKLSELGPAGMFAGYSLSIYKEALGYGVFFSVFETVKNQGYNSFVRRFYRDGEKPHYTIGPMFLLTAGIAASVAQQIVQHPVSHIQQVHYSRLESIDYRVDNVERSEGKGRTGLLRRYHHAYAETYLQCKSQAVKKGGWWRWLYHGFVWNTVRQVPSTAAGLIVFEVMRRRWAEEESRALEGNIA